MEKTNMMPIKKLAITCGTLMFAGVLMAQAPDATQAPADNSTATTQTTPAGRHRAADPAREAKHLGKKLGLSADQVSQLQPILADRNQQMQSLRSDTTLSQSDRRAKFQSIRQDSNTKIEALLNDQQKQQFEQMQQARRNHRAQGPQAQ
jgi:periplasmic protein CpxP/Spy